ncbi:MAG: thioredoxin family protein [Bacteroidetes bacterium]|nr:thioredoxin family protein [Bacteroidota bacterium]
MKSIFLTTLALLVFSSLSATAGGYSVGDKATDFRLMNVDGKMVSMADFPSASGFIVIFTCNHCPYSIAYEDRIIALDTKFKSRGYPVIAINPNDPDVQPEDSFDAMVERAQEKEFPFPYLLDEGQKIYPQYGATRTPHVFVLQKDGSDFRVRYIGAIDNNHEDADDADEHYVEAAVDALLTGAAPAVESTKAIGCSIKYKK